LLFLLLNLERI